MKRIAMEIEGMSCGHCVKAVTRALAEVDGATVSSVAVGRAEVDYDEAIANERALLSAVEAAGYPARAVAGAA